MTKHEKCFCIGCGAEMANILSDLDGWPRNGFQPVHGLAFNSQGHYGTTFFDPMDESWIEITVCDECLVAADEKGWVYRSKERDDE